MNTDASIAMASCRFFSFNIQVLQVYWFEFVLISKNWRNRKLTDLFWTISKNIWCEEIKAYTPQYKTNQHCSEIFFYVVLLRRWAVFQNILREFRYWT